MFRIHKKLMATAGAYSLDPKKSNRFEFEKDLETYGSYMSSE